jgi:methionine-gamma-lyase
MKSRPGANTLAVHGNGTPAGPLGTPIVHSSTFSAPSLERMMEERALGPAGAFYQRSGHPTLHACEQRLAALEGAERALLFSSGMGAISAALFGHLGAGDHVVALHQCYGGTRELLRWGAERLSWTYDCVDAGDPKSWDAAFRDRTRLFLVESPTNPIAAVVDLAAAAAAAHRHRALLIVDNTFASPVGQHPLELGADLVVYSATKSIGGHADLMAGAVIGSATRVEPVWQARTVFGPIPDPSTAWLVERSLKTLPLRVERQNANALALARRLAGDPRVKHTHYPGLPGNPGHEIAKRQMTLGFGPVLAFEVPGGEPSAQAVVERFRLVLHAPSLGGVETLASLPSRTSHVHLSDAERQLAGQVEGLIRLSVGIEDEADLWADLDQALGAD